MSHARLNDLARTIIDSNRYMVLGTADQAGHPWVTSVVRLKGLHALPLGLVARVATLPESRGTMVAVSGTLRYRQCEEHR
jgi:hypothetical protein